MMERKKILAVLPGIIPSTIIDVITPLSDLNKSGRITARITVETFVKKRDIEWCDLVVLCRNTHPNIAGWFLQILKLGKPYIYDIDDNFFDIPANTPVGKYHREPSRIRMLREYIKLAQLVRVYSSPMYERVQKQNQNIVMVTAPIDLRLIQPISKPVERQPVRLVYATSRAVDHLAGIFKPALMRILEEYQEGIEVHFLGYNPPEFRRYHNVYFQSMMFDYESYLKAFSSAGYDIGLAPLLNDVFHRSKTNNKFREYGACHIAGIYSNVDVYSSCVTNKLTGCLVENTSDAWYEAMSTLIQNADLRLQIKEQAYDFVRKNYSQETFASLWDQQITSILQHPIRRKKSTKAVEKLIAENSRTRLIAGILRKIFYLAIKSKDKLVNYLKMYWILMKIRNKLNQRS